MFKNLAEVDNIVKNGSVEYLEKLIAEYREYRAANYNDEEEEYEEEYDNEEYEEEEYDEEEDEDYLRCIAIYGDDRDPEILY